MSQYPQVFTSTPAIDATLLASGDRIDTAVTEIENFFADKNRSATIESLVLVDKASQGIALDVYFFNASPTTVSAANAAFSVSDAEMSSMYLGKISVAVGDYGTALALNSEAQKNDIKLLLKAASDSKSLFYCLVTRGTPTYGAVDALVLKLGAVRH